MQSGGRTTDLRRAKVPEEMVERVEAKQSQLAQFGLGSVRGPLLKRNVPAPKPPKPTKREP